MENAIKYIYKTTSLSAIGQASIINISMRKTAASIAQDIIAHDKILHMMQ